MIQKTFQFKSDVKIVAEVCDQILGELKGVSLSESDLNDLKLAFTEAFVNAVKHGNKSNPDLTVDIEVLVGASSIEVVIEDHGEGYNPEQVARCTEPEGLTKTHGRGVHLIKELMDEVIFENDGRKIRMIKKLN